MASSNRTSIQLPLPINSVIWIPLTKGYFAVLSQVDADIAALKWTADVNECGMVYACRRFKINGKWRNVRLHRLVLGRILGIELSRYQECDHEDGNGLNNTRTNLRLATSSQNKQNRITTPDSVQGVSWHTQTGKWRARIQIDGHEKSLGLFDSFDDAVKARHDAELEHYGEFSPLVSRTHK